MEIQGALRMKVYVLISTKYENVIESIFFHKKDAEDMEKSCSKDWKFIIEEHEVIE